MLLGAGFERSALWSFLMKRTAFVRGLVFICACIALLSVESRVSAQVDATAGTALAANREQYEATMEAIRREVHAHIDANIERARKLKGDNTAAVDAANAERAAFVSRGVIPSGSKAAKLERDYAQAALKMKRAYNDAKSSVGGESEFGPEAAAFWSHWDLNPWQERAVTGEVGVAPVVVEGVSQGEFRLDVRARRVGEAGELFIECAATEAERVMVPVLVEKDGRARAMLTVQDARVVGDLGVPRGAEFQRVKGEGGAGVALRAEGGVFVVESVRIKPIIRGVPASVDAGEDDIAPVKPRDQPRTLKAPATELLPPGSKWSGTLYGQSAGSRVANVTVLKNDGTSVRLAVVDKFGTAWWELRVEGRSFTVLQILPKSRGMSLIKNITGRGTIQGGKLRWDGKWTWQNRDAGGRVDAYLDLTRN